LTFYAGWPNAFSALPVVKEVFEKRQKLGIVAKKQGELNEFMVER
jgi:hypothetical protein